jgi:hypothetical protein
VAAATAITSEPNLICLSMGRHPRLPQDQGDSGAVAADEELDGVFRLGADDGEDEHRRESLHGAQRAQTPGNRVTEPCGYLVAAP